MTEIPEHLLKRSKQRRSALGLPGGEEGGDAAATAGDAPAAARGGGGGSGGGGGAVVPAGPTATESALEKAASAMSATPAAQAAVSDAAQAPYIQAAVKRKKIPIWALPVVVSLPVWGILYAGTLEPPTTEAAGLLSEGQIIYGRCASCHGATGGGGVGPRLDAQGDLLAVFPDVKSHVDWIKGGSASAVGGVYGATNKPSQGGMPAFEGTLTEEQILAVVLYERVQLYGQTDLPAEIQAAIDSGVMPTPDEATALIEGAGAEPAG